MKKITSTLIVATLCFSWTFPLFAQKIRLADVSPPDSLVAKNLYSVSALSDGNGVWLQWRTIRENEILGFNVYRVGAGGERQPVSPHILPSEYLTNGLKAAAGREYNHFDPQGGLGTHYIIESVTANGLRQTSRAFYPRYVADLTEVAGASSEELQRRAAAANPIIQKNDLEVPPDVAANIAAESKAVSPTAENDPSATQKWIASQPGAKIGVKTDGLYRVTRAQLQSAGFDVNAPTALWQLYADGVEQAIKIGPNGDYIEFYGRGNDLLESDTRVYYLVVGTQAGRRMGTTVYRAIGAPVAASAFQQTTVREEQYFYLNRILNGDEENWFGAFIVKPLMNDTTSGITTINLQNLDTTAATANVEINIQGYSYIAHQYIIRLNGTEIGTMSGINTDLITGTFMVPVSLLQEGENTVRIVGVNEGESSFTESVKITYARRYRAEQNQLFFYTHNYRQTRVQGFTSPDIRVFDMADVTAPKEVLSLQVRPAGGGYEVVMPSYRGRILYAVAGSGVRTDASVSANTPSSLSTPTNSANMVIISYKDWMTQAENWANYRRADGLTVKVVNVEDIYDEFSFGALSSESIRSFLNYAKNNWQTGPNYALLLGDGTLDPRNYRGQGGNFIPAKMVDTTFMETGSDDALADFNNDGLAELAIGRIPNDDAQTATTLLAKTMAFEQGLAQAPGRGALCASDEPNGYDFQGLCNRIFQSFPGTAGIPQSHLNRLAPDSRAQLLSAASSGKYIINYSGHGTVGSWAGNWFSRNDVPGLTNTNDNQTLWIMLTCLNGYFVDPFNDPLAEALVKKSQGGAVASWTSSGETTPDIQETMARRFYDQIAVNTTMKRIGDLSNDSKAMIPAGRDVRLSWVLLGDPTLKVKP